MNNARYEFRATALAAFPGMTFGIDADEEIPESIVELMRADKVELWMITDEGERQIG